MKYNKYVVELDDDVVYMKTHNKADEVELYATCQVVHLLIIVAFISGKRLQATHTKKKVVVATVRR